MKKCLILSLITSLSLLCACQNPPNKDSSKSSSSGKNAIITKEEMQLARDLKYITMPSEWQILDSNHHAFQFTHYDDLNNTSSCEQLTIDQLIELFKAEDKRQWMLNHGFIAHAVGKEKGRPQSPEEVTWVYYGRCRTSTAESRAYRNLVAITYSEPINISYKRDKTNIQEAKAWKKELEEKSTEVTGFGGFGKAYQIEDMAITFGNTYTSYETTILIKHW